MNTASNQIEIQHAMYWLLNANIGLSSKCLMATLLNGGKVEGREWDTTFHPHDPSDLSRCIALLDNVPSFRTKLDIMKSISPYWAVLVENWAELETLLREEKTHITAKAPETYARMQELFKSIELGHTK